jgi:hypothetical protein
MTEIGTVRAYTQGASKKSVTRVYSIAHALNKPSCVTTNEDIKQNKPVVDGAFDININAWVVSIQRSDTDSHDTVIVCEDSLAHVILSAPVAIVACSTKVGWNAYTHAKVSEFRLNFLAEAWALVAHSKAVVTVLAAGCSRIARARDAAARIAVATARSQGCLIKVLTCKMHEPREMNTEGGMHRIAHLETMSSQSKVAKPTFSTTLLQSN